MVNNYQGIKFPVSKKIIAKLNKKNNICINGFCYANASHKNAS